ncbi:hypothetical protein ACWDPV_01860 [Gordonia sp. NPDC003504]
MRSPDLFHALVLLNLLFACGLWTLLRPSIRAAAVLVLVAGAWVIWNRPLEGAVLLAVTSHNGLTESDLLSLVAVWIAVWAVTVTARRRTGRHTPTRMR